MNTNYNHGKLLHFVQYQESPVLPHENVEITMELLSVHAYILK